ncbi:response regulator transcription factor [Falsiroseomonas tokyonensis]|uniref:Response regulator transcription factor n=1 Tax=Falsiroseomonas tokyonensis TaxID=430521 RepID=A0ABV7BNG5_9PROT|nr:response regulator [Falsiroseomonas tokyonensis]MBU8536612.1 response regulator [Falsiroseomonas tokyonensis]
MRAGEATNRSGCGGAACYVVDDDAAVRRSVALLLGSAGYRVETFEHGDAFLDFADQELPFGCVILDVHMPGSDGATVQRELVARGLPHPIVVITGHGDVSLAVQMVRAGARSVLQKPFSGNALLRATQEAMTLRDDSGRH